MVRMWAVCILPHEGCSFSDFGGGGVGVGVEEVVGLEEDAAVFLLGVGIFVYLSPSHIVVWWCAGGLLLSLWLDGGCELAARIVYPAFLGWLLGCGGGESLSGETERSIT